jgi:hypothetical protein
MSQHFDTPTAPRRSMCPEKGMRFVMSSGHGGTISFLPSPLGRTAPSGPARAPNRFRRERAGNILRGVF